MEYISLLMAYLNPFSESVVLFVMIAFDTILGGKWRKNKGLGVNSKGAFNGSPMKMALALFPALIGFLGIGLNLLPEQNFGYVFVFPMFIFDIMAFGVFAWTAYYTALSIMANAELAGMPVPERIKKWAKFELESKLKRIPKD